MYLARKALAWINKFMFYAKSIACWYCQNYGYVENLFKIENFVKYWLYRIQILSNIMKFTTAHDPLHSNIYIIYWNTSIYESQLKVGGKRFYDPPQFNLAPQPMHSHLDTKQRIPLTDHLECYWHWIITVLWRKRGNTSSKHQFRKMTG